MNDMTEPEKMTRHKPTGVKSFRPKPTARPFTLIRKTLPKLKTNVERPYELKPRDKPVEAPELKGRPVTSWEYEPLNDERPANCGTQDGMSDKEPVDHPPFGARPVGVRIQTPRLENELGEDTASALVLRNGRVLPITKEGPSQEEGNDPVSRLEEGNGTTRMTGGGGSGRWSWDDIGYTEKGGVVCTCPTTTPATSAVRGAGLVRRGVEAPDNN